MVNEQVDLGEDLNEMMRYRSLEDSTIKDLECLQGCLPICVTARTRTKPRTSRPPIGISLFPNMQLVMNGRHNSAAHQDLPGARERAMIKM